MKKSLVFFVILLVSFFFPTLSYARTPVEIPPTAQYDDDVVSFGSDLTLNQDTTLRIVETIAYLTTQTKHGIYRYIPYRYEINGRNITTKISNISITDEDKASVPFTQSYEGNFVFLKIGDKDVTFTGGKTYQIAYTVKNSLLYTETTPHLTWDIVGESWTIPVHTTTATFHSPYAAIDSLGCASGSFGSNDGLCHIQKIDDHTVNLTYDKEIDTGDNVTIQTTLSPQNSLQVPTAQDRQIQMIKDNLWILLFILPPIGCLYLWNRFGRDFEFVRYNIFDDSDRETQKTPLIPRDAIPLVYEPLKISPGLSGAMLDESYDGADLTADIIDLARQKYMTIKQTQEKSWIKNANYEFTSLHKESSSLPPHQQLILLKIFETGDTVSLSDLKKSFPATFIEAQNMVFNYLTTQKYFTHNPNSSRFAGTVGMVLTTGILYFLFHIADSLPILGDSSTFFIFPLGFVVLVVCVLCIKNMTQKSAKGRNAMLQAKGLKDTLKRGAWREKIMESHLFFEEMLPFAISFGVVDQLAKAMKDLHISPPKYLGAVNAQSLYTAGFYNGLTSDIGSSLSPHSSSGGGGMSGGGGGGGGGGSW